MNKRIGKTSNLVKLALLSSVIVVMSFTPLGFIPLGFMNATTIHIPVILAALLLGPKEGCFLGAVFGLCSMIRATMVPLITSFVFTPFYSLGDVHGNFWSLVVCFVPRILIGAVSYFVYRFLKKLTKKENLSIAVAAFCGSMTNTLLVMNFIYLFFGSQYAAVNHTSYEALYALICSVILINGVPEAIIACILVVLICKAIKSSSFYKKEI